MKNRTIIGVICLVLAIIVTFVVAPLINRLADDTEEVVVVLQDIKQGSVITEEMVELAAFSKDNLPENPIRDLKAVIGKYAASNLYVIAGTFFICDCSGSNFGSLSQEQQQKYLRMFKYPERFLKINGELAALKYNPNEKGKDR